MKLVHAVRASLALDRTRSQNAKNLEATDFHPPALAILETARSPTVRVFTASLIAMVAAGILWATIGAVDMIAVAQGSIVSKGRSKVVQPLDAGVVRGIYARNGQRVSAGEVLMELDPAQVDIDLRNNRNQLTRARLEAAQAQALATLATRPESPSGEVFRCPNSESKDACDVRRRIVDRENEAFQAQIKGLESDVSAREADLAAAKEIALKFDMALPMLRARVEAKEELLRRGYQSENAQIELRQQLVEMSKESAAQKRRVEEAQATLEGKRRALRGAVEEYVGRRLGEAEEAKSKVSELTKNQNSAEHVRDLLKLRAPIDGTVQQLAVHTVGGVVTPAQELMVIAPFGSEAIEVEANVLNRDAGFVHAGQDVKVKVESYPFTRYGTIDGTVKSLSGDAVKDDKLGLVYPVEISLDRTTLNVDGREVSLEPGMAVTAEVVTGNQTLMQYLLSPIRRLKGEALRER